MEPGYSPLFLLALVAGFNFTKEWETTRYQLAREDGHKLYFRSTFWGLVVCVVTAALIVVFTYTAMGLYHQHLVHPFDTAIPLILGTLIISPFAAYLYASILNRFADALEF